MATKSASNEMAIVASDQKKQLSIIATNRLAVATTALPPEDTLRPVFKTNEQGRVATGFYGGGFVKDPNQPKAKPPRIASPAISNLFAHVISNAFQHYQEVTNRLPGVSIHTSTFNGVHGATVADGHRELKFSFYSSSGPLQTAQVCDRTTGRTLMSLVVGARGQLLEYSNSEIGEGALFYPSGALELAYWKGPDGKEHSVRMTREGYLRNQR